MLSAKSHHPYSWWWDSHLSPKNSKWLQENLTDMDANVKAMLKLIEEDADSFAKRAEMYYKKRPELVHLVEEFYRAYRALAERYDHISGELRQVHYSIAEAFPNQMPHMLHGDFAQASFLEWASDQSFESPQKTLSVFDADEMLKSNSCQQVASPFQIHKRSVTPPNTKEDASEVTKSQGLKQVNEIITQYKTLEKKVLQLQEELNHVQEEKRKTKEDSSSQVKQINSLEEQLLSLKKRNEELDEEGQVLRLKLQAESAEHQILRTEMQNLKAELQNSKQGCFEKGTQSENVSLENGARDDKIVNLQDELYQLQQENNRLSALVMTRVQQLEKTEEETQNLYQAFSKSHAEHETLILQYQNNLDHFQTSENTAKDFQVRLALLQEENNRLKEELSVGALHLKVMEDKAHNLEREKDAVQQEIGHIVHEKSLLIEELTSMRNEEQDLRMRLQDETAESSRVDMALNSCQQALSQSQGQQKLLIAEIQLRTERLKDADRKINFLKEEISQLQKENGNMVEQISSGSMSIKNLENEISKLKQEKNDLLNEVAFRVDQRNALQQELYCLQEERNDLDKQFQTIKKQIEPLGLDPNSLQSSFFSLQEDNQKLSKLCRNHEDNNITMENTVKRMEEELAERKEALENLVSSHTMEVEMLKGDIKKLQFLSQDLQEEKLMLIAESEQHNKQRNILEMNLHGLQKRISHLERENLDLKNELKDSLGHVEHLNDQLQISESVREQAKHEITVCHTQISDLDKQVCLLQRDGNDLRTKIHEEIEKQKEAQVEIVRLQKMLDEMEERNTALSDECQKHTGEFIAVEERVAELEKEIHMHKKENISLANNISSEIKLNKKLKVQICKLQNLLAVPDIVARQSEGADAEHMQLIDSIIEKVKILQTDLLHVEETNKRLSNGALAMSTYVEQLKTDMSVLQSEKISLEEQIATRSDHLQKLEKDFFMLQQVEKSLRIQLQSFEERERNLEEETKNLKHSLVSSENAKFILQEGHKETLRDYNSVKTQIDELQGKFCAAEQESQILFSEVLTQISLVAVLESNIADRDGQIQQLLDCLKNLGEEKKELENDVQTGSRKLQMLEVEVQCLQESIQIFEEDKRLADALQNEFKLLSRKCEQMNLQLETNSYLIKEKDRMLGELRQQLQVVEKENTTFIKDLENMKEKHVAGEMELNKLQLQVFSMTEQIIHLREAERNLDEEIKNLQHSLVSSHDAHLLLQDEHQRTLQDYNFVRKQIDELQGRFCVAEQENKMFLIEALTQMSLLTVLESNTVQRDEQVQQLVERLNKFDTEKMELENKVQTGAGKLQMLEVEVQKLQELIQRFMEEKRHTDTFQNELKLLNSKREQINLQLQTGILLLKEKDKFLGELKQQLQAVDEEKMTLVKDLVSVKQEHAKGEMIVNELWLQVSSLTKDNNLLKQELSTADKDRTKAKEELHGLQKERRFFHEMLSSSAVRENKLLNDVKQLQEKGKDLKNRLQNQTEEAAILELEVEGLHEALQFTQIDNALLKDGNQKIYNTCKLLETRTWALEEEILSIEQEREKQGTEAAAWVAQVKELNRSIADLETGKKNAAAEAATIFSLIAPLKEDVCALKEQVLGQMNVVKMDTHKLQDDLLKWLQDAMGKLQETNMELSMEAVCQAHEVQKLQGEIQHIVIKQEKENQTLKDEYHRAIEENCDIKATLEDTLNGKILLESENNSLQVKLHEHLQKAGLLQEERKVIEDELNVHVEEVQSLKAKLEETKEFQMHVLKLLELVIGPEQNEVSLNMESCQYAEDKLKEIHLEIFQLKHENEKLKDDTLRMSCKIDNLEAALCFKYEEEINDDSTQMHSRSRNFRQIEAENCTHKSALQWKPNKEGDKFLTLETGCKAKYQNGVLFEKEKMFFKGHEVEVADSYVCKNKSLLQTQERFHDIDSKNGELFQEKYMRLENQVQELSEKAKKFDAKSQEAQHLTMMLEEMQPRVADTQNMKEKIKDLQSQVKNLQQENIQIKGECTYSRMVNSHSKVADLVEVESLALQEEKEVVVDEAKGPAHTNDVIREIDILQEENRKYWSRLDFVTKKVQNLQNAIQELQNRLKSLKQKNKKLNDDRWHKGIDYNSLEKQLREHRGQVKQLLEHNNRLRKDVKYVFACINRIQEDTSGQEHKFDEDTLIACHKNARIAERLEGGSEKARVLESEVQRIRLTLSRFQQQILDDGPKIRVPLRTFLVGGRKERPPKQRACCACMHPPPTLN